jgi:hypothetical protein
VTSNCLHLAYNFIICWNINEYFQCLVCYENLAGTHDSNHACHAAKAFAVFDRPNTGVISSNATRNTGHTGVLVCRLSCSVRADTVRCAAAPCNAENPAECLQDSQFHQIILKWNSWRVLVRRS